MHTTNYFDAFITVAPDSAVPEGRQPPKPETVAGIQYALIAAHPYRFTSDEILFEVHARRNNIAEADRERERAGFFSKGQACLRASPLVKSYGWGVHFDAQGRVALYGVESQQYRAFAARPDIDVRSGMRGRRS